MRVLPRILNNLTLDAVLAENDMFIFGKRTVTTSYGKESENVLCTTEGNVVSTGWFEYDEDGWYMTVASNNPDGADVEFFGSDAKGVVDYFTAV